MARAFATIINVLDPDVIVLGGGVSNIERFYASVPPCCRSTCSANTSPPAFCATCMAIPSGVRGRPGSGKRSPTRCLRWAPAAL